MELTQEIRHVYQLVMGLVAKLATIDQDNLRTKLY